jgi:hypothetical protein
MIRAILMLAMLASPATAGDNNPFSGATSISVVMVREGHRTFIVPHKSVPKLKRTSRHVEEPCPVLGHPLVDFLTATPRAQCHDGHAAEHDPRAEQH